MTKHIIGAFHSEDEAIQAISELKMAGYKTDDLTVLKNRNSRVNNNNMESYTDVNIEKGPYTEEDATFWDKIKKLYSPEGTLGISPYEQLVNFGVSEEDAKKYDDETFNFYLIADKLLDISPSDSAFHHDPELSTNLDDNMKKSL